MEDDKAIVRNLFDKIFNLFEDEKIEIDDACTALTISLVCLIKRSGIDPDVAIKNIELCFKEAERINY